MQKRLMLAVGLSVGVLLVFQILFPPPKPPVTQSPKGTIETTSAKTAVSSTLSSSSSVPHPGSTRLPSSLAPTVTVATPLVKVSLSTLGGRLTSWEILSYGDQHRKTIELLPAHAATGGWSFEFAGESDRPVVYTASSPALTLGHRGGSVTLALNGRLKSGLLVTKRLVFHGDSYEATVEISLHNPSAQPVGGTVSLGWDRGLSSEEYAGALANVMVTDSVEQVKVKKLGATKRTFETSFKWAALPQPFAMAALYPPTGVAATAAILPSEHSVGLEVAYAGTEIPPRSGRTVVWKCYGGPQTYQDLKAPGVLLEHGLDYGRVMGLNFSWLGLWLILGLNTFFGWTHNYGLAIILLTVLIKLVLLWPAHASILSSRRMQALQPKLEELKERFKNNAQQLQVETMRMYRENKVNPLSGCLMFLPQFPIFIAFYAILANAAELQGQPFMLWIHDLSKMDPYYVLPILMGATQFIQTKMTPVADPAQAKIMLFMPLIFTFMFVTLPAGVVLYWTVQNLLAILHQWWVFRTPLVALGTSHQKGQ